MLSFCTFYYHTINFQLLIPLSQFRLTNIWGANLFSSCWFTLNTSDRIIENSQPSSSLFGFRFIKDLSDNFANSEGVHTTTRTKYPKRNYLCDNPCSHIHRKDTAGICFSKSLSRILAGSREVLDTMVTSILDMPLLPPSDHLFDSLRYLHNGAMSLPSKRCDEGLFSHLCVNTTCDDNAASTKRNKIPKSPVVIMSQWNKTSSAASSEASSYFESAPPCKLKRLASHQQVQLNHQNQAPKSQMDDCISHFTSLSVQQQMDLETRSIMNHQSPKSESAPLQETPPEKSAPEKRYVPLIRKPKNSKSFTEVFSSDSVSFNARTGLPLQSSPVSLCVNFGLFKTRLFFMVKNTQYSTLLEGL